MGMKYKFSHVYYGLKFYFRDLLTFQWIRYNYYGPFERIKMQYLIDEVQPFIDEVFKYDHKRKT